MTLWKDVLKPVAAVAMGGLALAEVAHYLTIGPNVEEDVEDHHHEFEENKPSKGKIMSKLKLATILALSAIEPQHVSVTGCWLFAFYDDVHWCCIFLP